jgi:hypothetical protein
MSQFAVSPMTPRSTRQETRNKIYHFSMLYSARCWVAIVAPTKGLLPDTTLQDTGGVDFYLDQQHLDTTTPTGKLLFHVTGAFFEFERNMIRQRVNAGSAPSRQD